MFKFFTIRACIDSEEINKIIETPGSFLVLFNEINVDCGLYHYLFIDLVQENRLQCTVNTFLLVYTDVKTLLASMEQ